MPPANCPTWQTEILRTIRTLGTSARQGHPSLLVLALILLGARHRFAALSAMVNVDMYFLWSRRIRLFTEGLFSGNLSATYQSHHPGVLFMWIEGLLWKLFGLVEAPVNPEKLWVSTLPVAIVGLGLGPATFLLLRRLLGKEHTVTSFVAGALLATEPMMLAHSRNAHLDMLVGVLSWSSVLAALIAYRSLSRKWAITSGVLLGLGLLSKVSAGGFALGITLLFSFGMATRRDQRLLLLHQLLRIGLVSAAVVVVLWPALWVHPLAVIHDLRVGALRDVDKASVFMFLGDTGKLSLPWGVYGFYAVFLLTPEFILPSILGASLLVVAPRRLAFAVLAATLVCVPFFVLVATSSHVGARYLIPFLPYVAFVSGATIETALRWLGRTQARWGLRPLALGILLVVLSLRLVRAEHIHPLPITYCSTWTGIDCTEVFHLGWGEGLREAALKIRDHLPFTPKDGKVAIYGSPYAKTMGAWLPLRSVGSVKDAELLVDYIADWQRNVATTRAIEESVRERKVKMLWQITFNGRPYVRIYPGPKYRTTPTDS
jgi:4-amino-4-deoxy-L-arabinose transferase-like glycosyltransferase